MTDQQTISLLQKPTNGGYGKLAPLPHLLLRVAAFARKARAYGATRSDGVYPARRKAMVHVRSCARVRLGRQEFVCEH